MPYNLLDESIATDPALTLDAGPLTSEGKTLADMVVELQARFGQRSDVSATRITGWINDAYIELAASLVVPETMFSIQLSTVVGSYAYLLPQQVRIISSVAATNVSGDDRPITKTDLPTYRKFGAVSDDARYYLRFGTKLFVLWPTPVRSETIVIDGYIRPAKLVGDTDSPILPEEYHDKIQSLAEAKGYAALGMREDSSAVYNDYIAGMRSQVDAQAEERTGMVSAFRSARHMRNVNRLRGGEPNDF